MFVNFKNVLDTMRPDLPFGLAQIGKAYRNEIAPRDFLFRAREFVQMEIEYFVRPGEWENAFELWRESVHAFNEAVGIPLAVHGGTGLSDEQCRKLIANGVAKINYYTALSEVAANAIKANVSPGQKSYKAIPRGVHGAIRAEVERCIRLWGSSGRAAEVLAQCRPWREVERIVLYNQPESLTEEAAAAMVLCSKETLAAIPGVRRVLAGTAVNGEKRRRCWLVRLATPEMAASFNKHPDQLKFANSLSPQGAADKASMDFEIGE